MNAKAIVNGKHPSIDRVPRPVQSLMRHEYNVCLILEFLDERLKGVENTLNDRNPDYAAYSEAMVFLDAIYLFSRMLMDSVAGIIKHFYKFNTINDELPKSFNNLIKNSGQDKFPKSLDSALQKCRQWFPQLKERRDDIIHHYETYFIGFSQNSEGQMLTSQLSPRDRTRAIRNEDIRSYIGGVLAGYQDFIDSLLDHWDEMFKNWFGIIKSNSSRQLTILEGKSANILWWAYKYGGYKNKEMIVEENYASYHINRGPTKRWRRTGLISRLFKFFHEAFIRAFKYFSHR